MDQLNKSTNFAHIDFTKILNDAIQKANGEKVTDPQPVVQKEDNEKKTDIKPKISNKCSVCKKKLILAGTFDCACDEYKRYCPTHRFPEEHSCTKGKSKVELIKVVADKLEKI
jgi:hypothetical protein